MLGADLVRVGATRGVVCSVSDLPDFDICKKDSLARELPVCDAVLNCAAYTRVDDAEREHEAAMRINAEGAGYLAEACALRGLPLIHISTDYVFDGRKGAAYVESDPVAPLNYYGLTKLEGERAVQAAGGGATIVRTQSLYGVNGRNFVKAILNQIRQGNRALRVVNDQVSAPTYTAHLAEALFDLAALKPGGIVHVAAQGACSWFDFAREIVRRVGVPVEVLPRSTAELNYPALRPAYSVLDTSRFHALTGRAMPGWAEGLAAYLSEEPLAQPAA